MRQSVGRRSLGGVSEVSMFFLLNNDGIRFNVTLPNDPDLSGFSARPFAERCIAAVTTQDKREPADYRYRTPLRAILGAGRGPCDWPTLGATPNRRLCFDPVSIARASARGHLGCSSLKGTMRYSNFAQVRKVWFACPWNAL